MSPSITKAHTFLTFLSSMTHLTLTELMKREWKGETRRHTFNRLVRGLPSLFIWSKRTHLCMQNACKTPFSQTHILYQVVSSQASGRREESPLSHAREGFISDEGQERMTTRSTCRQVGEGKEKSREKSDRQGDKVTASKRLDNWTPYLIWFTNFKQVETIDVPLFDDLTKLFPFSIHGFVDYTQSDSQWLQRW